MVNDLVEVNKKCIPVPNSLPNLEMQLSWLPAERRFMGLLDLLSGFDMLAVDDESSRLFCITTPFGIYRLLVSPQGFLNTPSIFMLRMIKYVLEGLEITRYLAEERVA